MEKSRSKLSIARRNNAKLYPIYKMFSWDLLFYYSIEFLFITMTKAVAVSELLMISALYFIMRILTQIPAVAVTDFLGKRKSIIFGNVLILIHMIALIILPGASSVIVSNLIFSFGYNIKLIAESNILYDSVATKGGDGLYSKLEGMGGSWYYILDGIASLVAGYLFVINNYLPMFVCLGFITISVILSFKFQDIYEVDEKQNKGIKTLIKEYKNDLKTSCKFIVKSKRMKSFIIFGAVFNSIISVASTYRKDLLTFIGVGSEQFSMIFAILTLIGGISISFKKSIEKKFKNRTLAFISIIYIMSCIIIGTFSSLISNTTIIPIILVMYAIQNISISIFWILDYKYLKNFTEENMRNKITFTYEFIVCIVSSIVSVLGGLLLDKINTNNAFLILGLASLAIMTLVLDYMRKRFGLKPEEYSKEDIEFVETV